MKKNPKIDNALDEILKNLQPGKELSRDQIAHACGCSANYIRHIEIAAINKIKKCAHRYGLIDYQNREPFEPRCHQIPEFTNPMRAHY